MAGFFSRRDNQIIVLDNGDLYRVAAPRGAVRNAEEVFTCALQLVSIFSSLYLEENDAIRVREIRERLGLVETPYANPCGADDLDLDSLEMAEHARREKLQKHFGLKEFSGDTKFAVGIVDAIHAQIENIRKKEGMQ